MKSLFAVRLLLLLLATSACSAEEVQISVMSLFHPRRVVLEPAAQSVLVVRASSRANAQEVIVEDEPGHRSAPFQLVPEGIAVANRTAQEWSVTARDGGPAAFTLQVPGKLRRTYHGRLTLRSLAGRIDVMVGMELETAVASIVAAEMEPSAPLEALKAQAVVTRSFLMAGHRHLNADFCDTTHCQFLKSPPPASSRVWSAVTETRGQVMTYRTRVLAAMYSSRCGGRTRALQDAGYGSPAEDGQAQYPYYAVDCTWCLRHPLNWSRHLDGSHGAPRPGDERRRIAAVRQSGWAAIPGNDFSASSAGTGWRLEGHNLGHGIGLCQMGAIGMAQAGLGYRLILAHYYPNSSLRMGI